MSARVPVILFGLGLVCMGSAIGGQIGTWMPEDRRWWLVVVESYFVFWGVLIGKVIWTEDRKQ